MGRSWTRKPKYFCAQPTCGPCGTRSGALSAGRGSRLSQILQHTREIKEHGSDYDHDKSPPDDLSTLSVLGIADFANALLGDHKGIKSARDRLKH